MPKERKKGKITNNGALALNGGDFSMSIGDIVGKASETEEKSASRADGDRPKTSAPAGKTEEQLKSVQKITLHRQSAGMGGKTAVVVTLSGAGGVDLEALAKELRKGLGCGSRVLDGKVVLQGDIAERARDWFIKKGAKRVVLGN